MSRIIKCGLIQASNPVHPDESIEKIRQGMLDKHCKMIDSAAQQGVKIICLQEIFTGPYFCAEQKTRWYELAEDFNNSPTIQLMQEYAKKHSMVIVVPIYEKEMTGIYYNTAAVVDA